MSLFYYFFLNNLSRDIYEALERTTDNMFTLICTGFSDDRKIRLLYDATESIEGCSLVRVAIEKSKGSQCWMNAIESLVYASAGYNNTKGIYSPIACHILGPSSHLDSMGDNSPEVIRQNLSLAFTNCQLEEDGLRTYLSVDELVKAQSFKADYDVRHSRGEKYESMIDMERSSEAKMSYGIYTQYRLHLLSLCNILEHQHRESALQESVSRLHTTSRDTTDRMGIVLHGLEKVEALHRDLFQISKDINFQIHEEIEHRSADFQSFLEQIDFLRSKLTSAADQIHMPLVVAKNCAIEVHDKLEETLQNGNTLLSLFDHGMEKLNNVSAVIEKLEISTHSLEHQQKESRTHVINQYTQLQAISAEIAQLAGAITDLGERSLVLNEKNHQLSDNFLSIKHNLADLDHFIDGNLMRHYSFLANLEGTIQDTHNNLKVYFEEAVEIQSQMENRLSQLKSLGGLLEGYRSGLYALLFFVKIIFGGKFLAYVSPIKWASEIYYIVTLVSWALEARFPQLLAFYQETVNISSVTSIIIPILAGLVCGIYFYTSGKKVNRLTGKYHIENFCTDSPVKRGSIKSSIKWLMRKAHEKRSVRASETNALSSNNIDEYQFLFKTCVDPGIYDNLFDGSNKSVLNNMRFKSPEPYMRTEST